MRNYIDGIWDQIRRNWSIPPDAQGKGYLAIVEVALDRRGRLLRSRIEQSSGNSLYDRAAMRAVDAANAKGLPAMPPNAGEDEFVFGLRFRD
jgi:colicin import membrane protein